MIYPCSIIMLKRLKSIFNWCALNFYSKPKNVVKFIFNSKKYCSHKSYFPNLPQKSGFHIWIDQLIQCIRFGYPNDFYFPYGFDVKSNSEINKYLHYAPFMRMRDSNNQHSHSATAILRNKLYFGFFTDALGVNSGKNCGLIKREKTFSLLQKNYVSTDDFLLNLKGKYIFKPIDGECGTGIFILDSDNGKFKIGKEDINIESLRIKLKDIGYLVQSIVSQHPEMARLHPQSLNTIRLVTIRDSKTRKIILFPSILRIGTGGSFVDNTSQGGIAVAVNLEDGSLGEYGYYKPEFGTRTDTHPNSGIKFSQFTIPFFNKAKEQAIRLHSMLPNVQSIGWDIAIGENGPVFIEGNDNWEINGPQICNGPLKEQFYHLCKKNGV